MGWIRGVAFAVVTLTANADTQVCADLLSSGTFQKIVQLTRKLNPTLIDEQPISPEPLYLLLKREQERPSHLPTPRHDLTPEDRAQFYQNSLRDLQRRTATLWKIQEVRNQLGPIAKPALEEAAARILDTFFTPYNLEDRELTEIQAREYMRTRPWMMFKWQAAIALLIGHMERFPKFTRRTLGDVYEQNSHGLSYPDFERIANAMNRISQAPTCCKSTPGCVTCPQNRRWLK